MGNFRIEHIETSKDVNATQKGFIKVFTNTKDYLPIDIDVENRFGVLFTEGEEYLEQIQNFEVRKDDVWVVTTPKSGTTWMLEMAWLLMNNLDYETAKKVDQRDRCRYLECIALDASSNSIEEANKMKSPRVLKTHLPMHMLPKDLWSVKPKIIYVTRDPKDAIVSYHHFVNNLGLNSCNVDEFVNEAIKHRTIYSPFWSHVAEFWKIRNESYVHFTSFERMKKDLTSEVLKVSKFLEKILTNEELEGLVEHLTFDKMKDNQSCNNSKWVEKIQNSCGVEKKPMRVFIRKGKVGSYKEDLNNDLIQALEDWTEKSTKFNGINPNEILYS
ncbi:sulfotransferase 1 family member D1-like [Eupeodes corollae]|uniref:sulfotransferase 1 family member D1-like n=1 Tax=Eupeodes corollae TaxID=290404 RepID=UPI002493A00A|nr:sulfotransferase 1 family member D1-like [Eupeodes corollae]